VRSRFAAATSAVFIIVIVVFLALSACNRKGSSNNQEKNAAVPATPAGTPAAPAGTPAAPASGSASTTDTGAAAQPGAADTGAAATGAAPAADNTPQPIVVDAGTKLTVKLGDELSSETSQNGQSFSATLDRDVVVDGQTAIPSGANVSGVVVSAHSFGKYAGEASLTLKLTSVNVNNTDQDIVTASRTFTKPIHAKGKVKKFLGGLVKRAEGEEKEMVLSADSTYTFTLKKPLTIQ